MEKNAWISAKRPPKTIAIRSPTTHEPLHAVAQMPKNAPASIIPSSPMLITPARSLKMPPIAAKASGVAKRSVAASRPIEKIASSGLGVPRLEPEARRRTGRCRRRPP